jgi:hypothetical protein
MGAIDNETIPVDAQLPGDAISVHVADVNPDVAPYRYNIHIITEFIVLKKRIKCGV